MKKTLILVLSLTLTLAMTLSAAAGLSNSAPEFSFSLTTPEPTPEATPRSLLSSASIGDYSIATPEPTEESSAGGLVSSYSFGDYSIATPEPAPEATPRSLLSSAPTMDYTITIPDVEIQQRALEKAPDLSDYLPDSVQSYYLDMVGTLSDNELNALASMTEAQAAELIQLRYELINDLIAAFEAYNISLRFNRITGRVIIDANLLYATDQYEVTPSGREILALAMRIYCEVLERAKYRDYISHIVIVGHTDSDGSYEYNVKLSQRRAQAVLDYVMTGECGVPDLAWVSSRLVAEGHSYDERIFNPDGTENKAASRRVELGFDLILFE